MSTTIFSIATVLAASGLAVLGLLREQQNRLNSILLSTGLLLLACLEIADRFALSNPDVWLQAKSFALIFESLLIVVWLLYATTFARKALFRSMSPLSLVLLSVSLALPVFAFISPLDDFFYSPDFADERLLFLSQNAYWFYLGVLFFIVVSLYRLERTLVALSAIERSKVLYEILGIGTVLVVLLVYYSQPLLHRTIDMNLVPIRSLALLVGICLCGYSRFKHLSTEGVVVSRDVASRSVVVLAVGCYLLLLGGAGEGLRYFGIQNQRLPFIGFAVLSGLVFTLMLLSEKNRRKLNVFLSKHFYRHKYDYRNEWLMFTAQLSAADNMDKLQSAILTFYCETFGRKGASLYLLDADSNSYQQRASHFLEFPEACFLINHPLVEYFNETDWVFNTEDQHPELFEKIRDQLEPYHVNLCVPLQYEQDLEGFLMLGEAVNPDEVLNFEDYDLMKVLASQATSVLLSSKLSAQLSTAQEMAAIGKVSTFVIHDLKNHVSSLALVVDNARDHMDNPEFQADMLETLDETIGKVNTLITRLKTIKEKKDLNIAPCDLAEAVRRGVKASGLNPEILQDDGVVAMIDSTEIEKVVHNLVLNAHEAGSEDGPVSVRVGRDEMAYFEVSDRGSGMSDDFIRNRLFQPFQTTKEKGFGIGLYQCRQIIEAHKGRIEVSSKVDEGTTFKILFPLANVSE